MAGARKGRSIEEIGRTRTRGQRAGIPLRLPAPATQASSPLTEEEQVTTHVRDVTVSSVL